MRTCGYCSKELIDPNPRRHYHPECKGKHDALVKKQKRTPSAKTSGTPLPTQTSHSPKEHPLKFNEEPGKPNGFVVKPDEPLHQAILRALQSGPQTLAGLTVSTDSKPSQTQATLKTLVDSGHIKLKDELFHLVIHKAELESGKTAEIKSGNGHFRFAAVSDTHLCSTHEMLDELHDFYDKAKAWKAEMVVHAGDVVAGFNVYRGQEFELKVIGADAQIQYAADNYPNNGLITHFIDGNHDEALFKKAGVVFGQRLSEKRKDMVYLGAYEGNLEINGIRVQLWHGAGGNAYSLSYKLQRGIDAIIPGAKPRIMFAGHWHSVFWMFYRNIDAYLPGCFEGQTLLGKRLKLQPAIGGWLVELEIANGEVKKTSADFIPYYYK